MQAPPVLLVAICLVTSAGMAGCILPAPVIDAQAFVLEFRIVDQGHEEKYADPGAHCGTARRTGDVLRVSVYPNEEIPETPWLTVFPSMPNDWHAGLGASPYKRTFPATVNPGVPDDPTDLGSLAWEPTDGGGTLRLDGRAIDVPHAWSVTGVGGTWRADATIDAWRGGIEIERLEGFCD